MDKPVIAITMGDPAGIGPEIIAKVLSRREVYDRCRPFVVGDPQVMHVAAQVANANLSFRRIDTVTQAAFELHQVDVLCPDDLVIGQVTWGQVKPAMGQAAATCLKTAVELGIAQQIQGMVSAPMNKEAFHLAGYDYSDELEFLADVTQRQGAIMFGVANSIWTVMVTEHIAFRDILGYIKKDRILWYIDRMHQLLSRVGLTAPRIAVAALNVHAGEGGLFGTEEIEEIQPAIEEAKARGLTVDGPVPADMVFVRALAGDFDGIVFMYHDQANIARKLQPKEKGATLFVGLPIPCGTTAHGTAFDIAGQGIADPGSLAAALEYTIQLSTTNK